MTAPADKITWTEERLRQLYKGSADVFVKPCRFGASDKASVVMVYANGLCDTGQIHEFVLPVLTDYYERTGKLSAEEMHQIISRLSLFGYREPPAAEDIDEIVFEGGLFLYFVQEKRYFQMGISDRPQRMPSESSTEISIKGPKDGFVEDMAVNVALIRKRLRSHSLHVQEFKLGRRTKTKLSLMYFEDIINPKILSEVRKSISSIDTDGIYSINQLEEALTGNKYKFLPLLDYTGRPDYCVNSLLSGRFIIVIDGNPLVVIGPAGLTLLLKSPEDIHFNYTYVSFARLIRISSLFLTVFLPGIWVALMAFHQDQLPFRIMATISVSRLGLPFSAQIEMFILLMLLEIFREAGVRLPTSIGQTLTSIGGLIIGDAAIRAGLVSPSVVVIGAITAVSGVTLVNQSLSTVVSIIRLFFFLLSSFLGMYGVILGIVIFIALMGRQQSFGVSYLAPLSPLKIRDLIASFLRLPWFLMKRRPVSLEEQDEDR
ncbi:spore germination protein [Paenibacillus glycanilyticus]|uniref:Spore germination protein KA n=1 Tax=Paenibacillus glycanilyticus TaxID=126569 RepID=A0ABQ6GG06_9BACL|nr:spore germination protein [Paenibacillus glycanilyticus]GLX69886.1 spore germination protein KA [Paenibacillus glycanilyticus]